MQVRRRDRPGGDRLLLAQWVRFDRMASVGQPRSGPWDLSRAETLSWSPDDERFTQGFALETSGLAFADDVLVAPSEKYGRLLFFSPDLEARVVELGVPPPCGTRRCRLARRLALSL